VTKYTVQIDIN